MSRDHCFHCGKELAFVPKKGVVFAIYIDPLGHEHKMHKECLKYGDYGKRPVTAQPHGRLIGDGLYAAERSES